jgi:hypothetical protein
MRYSCAVYEEGLDRKLFPLDKLISADLARRRLALLWHTAACGFHEQVEDGTVWWDVLGVMHLRVRGYLRFEGDQYIRCRVGEGWEKHKVVEIIINALLSPIGMQRGSIFLAEPHFLDATWDCWK